MVSKVILNHAIEIGKEENPGLNIGELRKRFTYANPFFGEARRLRLSTHGIPEKICLFQDRGPSLVLARGLISAIIAANPGVEIIDQTNTRPVGFPPAARKSFISRTAENLN